MIVEVIGEDVNLRVSPSTEADVATTIPAGTRLTVLETVTAEDGTTWYKVSYEDVEGYIRSDMAQVVDDSEQEPAEDIQEEEPQPEITRYDYKSDEVNVKVTLTDPADLPDNAELSVTPVELTQEAEAQITEKAIKEVGDKLDANDKAAVEADCQALKDLLAASAPENTTDEQVAQIKAAKEKLTESAQKLFTKMYEQAGAAAGAGAGAAGGPTPEAGPAPEGFQGDDVVDGDYKEV